MRTLRTVSELRAALAIERRAGRTIGLVPTMGAFHEGHLSLMRAARERADVVVVSLFINPAQFNADEDLAAYPRDEAGDARQAEAHGVDVLFAPSTEEVYPAGAPTTEVRVRGLTEPLEGVSRGRAHFDGVTTVVAKLFNMVRPDVTFFGAKDAQQAAVVRAMVRDLDFGIEIVTMPTVREPDGLAMSSRNVYLEGADRENAIALRKALDAAEAAVHDGERDPATVARNARDAMRAYRVEPEYLALVEPTTFAPVSAIDGDVLVAVAARVGPARLIDNTLIRKNGRH